MRVRLLVICALAALTACLRTTYYEVDGNPGDGDSGSADDASIDARLIDAGPVGHDEDGDGVDDALDNCPQSANANQRDVGETNAGRQADGVGDTCDPDPDLPGNSIVFFDGMNNGVVPNRWNASGASDNGDRIRIEQNGYLISLASYPGRALINISVQLGSTTQPANSIVIASNYVTGTSYIGCRRQVNQLNLMIGSTTPAVAAPVFAPGQEIWMELMTNASAIDCGTSIDNGVWTPINQTTSSTMLPGGGVMVAPTGTFALVDFVIVISRP